MKKEIFKDIAGFKGLYQIGNKGTVRSLVFRNNQTSFEKVRVLKPFKISKQFRTLEEAVLFRDEVMQIV